jgi:hypothetical protein
MLTEKEARFLHNLNDRLAKDDACIIEKMTPAIQSLIDRGYCRLVSLRTFLGPTGEKGVRVTEAGNLVLGITDFRRI